MANYARIAKQVQAAAAERGSVAAQAKHGVEQQRREAAAEKAAQQERAQAHAEVLRQRRVAEEARQKAEQEAQAQAERERQHAQRLQQAEARREAERARAAARAEIESMLQHQLASLPPEEEPAPRNWMQNVHTDRGRPIGQQASALEGAMHPGESQADAAARLIDELQQGRLEVAEALRNQSVPPLARGSGAQQARDTVLIDTNRS
jgi:colicin import membrane protein